MKFESWMKHLKNRFCLLYQDGSCAGAEVADELVKCIVEGVKQWKKHLMTIQIEHCTHDRVATFNQAVKCHVSAASRIPLTNKKDTLQRLLFLFLLRLSAGYCM
jgi:hypothetical protein